VDLVGWLSHAGAYRDPRDPAAPPGVIRPVGPVTVRVRREVTSLTVQNSSG
jgi:hypothetical protein